MHRPGRSLAVPIHVTGLAHPNVPRFDALFGGCRLPLGQRVEAVANPNVIGDCRNQSDFLNKVFIGQRVEPVVVWVLRALEAFSNDAGDKSNCVVCRQSSLKLSAHLLWL